MTMNEKYLDRREIVIMVSHKCNLRCKYCYYDKTSPECKSESLDMVRVKQLLTKEFSNCSGPIRITYHGGEPFVNWTAMRDLSMWALDMRRDIKFLVTTNGTLLSEDAKQWLKSHKDQFTVVLSIDGPREVHDSERPDSFDRIDRGFFVETYPTVGVKMTVSPKTLPHMYRSFLYLVNEGFYVNPSLAREVKWDKDIHLILYRQELEKLANWYLEHPSVPPAELLGINFVQQPRAFGERCHCTCGAGRDIVAYDIDGTAYPCHSFIDFTKPKLQDDLDQLFALLKRNDAELLNSPCTKCIFAPWCAPCYGLSYVNRGGMGRLDEQMCLFSAVTIPFAAKLQGEMLASGRDYCFLKKFSAEEKALMAKSIYAILSGSNNAVHSIERR